MSPHDILVLESKLIDSVCERHPPQTFQREFTLFHKGQIPNLGFLLISGEIILKIMRSEEIHCLPGTLIGLKQMFNDLPASFSAMAKVNSKLCLIDKTSAKEGILPKKILTSKMR